MRACGARAARSDSQVCSRRSEAAGGSGCSSGERACLGWHDREQRQLAFLLFSCRRKRCKSAPASVRSAPARRRRERRLAARSAHRRSLLAPASARGKRVMGAVDRAAARARGELRMHGGEWLTAWGALCTFETRAEAALAKLRSCGAAELVGKPAAATSQTFSTDCICRSPRPSGGADAAPGFLRRRHRAHTPCQLGRDAASWIARRRAASPSSDPPVGAAAAARRRAAVVWHALLSPLHWRPPR